MSKLVLLAVLLLHLTGCSGAGTWVKSNVPEHQQDSAWEHDRTFCLHRAVSSAGPRPVMAPSPPPQPQAPKYNIEYRNQYGVRVGSATATPENTGPSLASNVMNTVTLTTQTIWNSQVGKLQRQCLASKGWKKMPSK